MALNNESNRNFERKALYISQDHCRVILSAIKELSLLIEDWLNGNKEEVRERHKRISKFEKDANEIKWKLLDLLSNATTLLQREDIMRLATEADMIADNAEAVAYKVNMAENISNLPKIIGEDLKKMSDSVLRSMDKLRECIMMLEQNVNKASEISKQVDEIEEETDAIHRRLMREIIDSLTDYKELYLLSSIIEQLEETSDQIKTSADSVRIISMSIYQ
ncbi:MAG: DUF47 domain-containing protein [Candidatus Odinarchaeia archaeon]